MLRRMIKKNISSVWSNGLKNKGDMVLLTVLDKNGGEHSVSADSADTIAESLALSGLFEPLALCSGIGNCGRCQVRLERGIPETTPEEKRLLSESRLQQGWRLGCRHRVKQGMRIFVPAELRRNAASVPEFFDGETVLAVDLGTSSIWWRCADRSGRCLAEGHFPNPQLGTGSDVVSRIAFALDPHGRIRLREAVLKALRRTASRCPGRLSAMCVAGNTAMTAILLDADVHTLASAPYGIPDPGDRTVVFEGLPPCRIPPQIAPFVGGDVSAGLAALLLRQKPPFLLIDMGTNGEFVLVTEHGAAVSSIPLGPALEGMGLSCGGIAEPGAVSAFSVSPSGLQASVIGGGEAQHLCGVGALSLTALLVRIGVLNRDGRPAVKASLPLAKRLLQNIIRDDSGWKLKIPGGFLTGRDVEEILKVKAAFSMTLAHLAAEYAEEFANQNLEFVLSGAFGAHISPENLETLNFLPPGSASRTIVAGNTSLDGAEALLLYPDIESSLRNLCRQCAVVSRIPDHSAEYISHMHF
ncbi:MAG: ASKHA domain-containing protein [Desulfovibrionaceae bacterium]|nr:ASKHA domain-containing protein [Desulfovibrionaceae bacterium]